MHVATNISTRWAALGAAVAVSLGAGGVGLVQATSPGEATTFVAMTPCRLFDTRPAPATVGERSTPLAADETFDVAGRGAQGDCTLPNTAVGLALNVTAVDASQATFLTIYPAGAERPTASHLNPAPGSPPAPNAATVDLSDDGRFSVFNRFGTVHVIADVVGYYTDHHHDDRYYTEGEVDALIAPLTAEPAALPYLPHLLDLVPEIAQYWGFEDGWIHLADSPRGCLVTAVDVPAGTEFTRVTFAHSLLVLPNAVDVEIMSLRRSVGGPDPSKIVHFRDTTGVPTGPPGQDDGTVIFEHDPAALPPGAATGPVPVPGYDTVLRLCADTSIIVQSIEIS